MAWCPYLFLVIHRHVDLKVSAVLNIFLGACMLLCLYLQKKMDELEISLKLDNCFQTKFECSCLSAEQFIHLPTGTAWKGMYN